jgi:hypothetical protein
MTAKNYNIKVDQQAGQNRGSMVGAQINIGVSDVQAPERTEIATYLQGLLKIIGEQQPAAESPADAAQPQTDGTALSSARQAALQWLWQQTFYVRRPAQTKASRRSLQQAIQALLDFKRPQGVRQAMVLLADAGVGKTPALQHIVLQIAEKSLPHFQAAEAEQHTDRLVPLLIRLAELQADQPFLSLVRAAFNRYAPATISLDQAAVLLQTYDCLLLLDDLDKVAFGAQSGGIKLIREFMDNYPWQRYLITCRTSSYYDQLGPLVTFVLDELSDEQVTKVLGELYDERLLPLARNRAMLKIWIEEGHQEEVRWSRGRLLQRMVWAQLRMHQAETDIELEMIEAFLERLAYQMHRERANQYSERQLMEFITSYLAKWHEPYAWRRVTQRLRQIGMMQPDELRQWRFRNRSTQAYFVAAAMYRDPALLPLTLDHASDVWWREPLEILVGLLDEPSELLFELIDRDALVAAHCLQFAGQTVEQRVINAIIDALIEQMRYERAAGREELVRQLSKTGHLPPQPLLWQLLYRERKSLVIVVLAQALADANLRRKQYNFSPIPETEAIKIDPDLLSVINLWQEHMLTDLEDVRAAIEAELMARMASGGKRRERVRGLAAIVLGYIGMDVGRVPVRQALLAELTRPRLIKFVAWCATDALSQIKHEAVERAAIQLYQSQQGRINQVAQQRRVYAVYLLGAVGGRFETTTQILYDALVDANAELRGHAAYAIGRLGLLEARERLEERLESRDPRKREQEAWPLRRTVEALGRVGTLESIHVLEPYLRHEQRRTRERVRDAIAEIRRRYELR